MNSPIEVRVAAVTQITPVIREFTFEPVRGALPGFSSGSHVVVHMPVGERSVRNAYSLLSNPAQTQHYRIAVRLQDESRGGSRYMHEQVKAGDLLQVSPPANLFAPNSQARHHLLIAGGIGITPFLSYLPELQARDASYSLHYAFRGGFTDAYLDSLRESLGTQLQTYDSIQGQALDLASLLASQALGTHVYVCGPQRLIDGVRTHAEQLGWPESRVHWEVFAAPEPGHPFVANLARSGLTVEVASDSSLLEALEQAGVEIPNLCRGGVCGQCAVAYLDGAVEHRDAYLSATERSNTVMPCVSRGLCGSALLLDL